MSLEGESLRDRERERVMMGLPYEMIDEVSLHAEKVLRKFESHLLSLSHTHTQLFCNGFICEWMNSASQIKTHPVLSLSLTVSFFMWVPLSRGCNYLWTPPKPLLLYGPHLPLLPVLLLSLSSHLNSWPKTLFSLPRPSLIPSTPTQTSCLVKTKNKKSKNIRNKEKQRFSIKKEEK